MGKWRKEKLTDKIIEACINVHKELGSGFLESIYQNALIIELKRNKFTFESEKAVNVEYLGIKVGSHKIDLFIEGEVVVELKTVEEMHKKYYTQVRSYLKALNKEVGLLVNFADFKIDIRRVELKRNR